MVKKTKNEELDFEIQFHENLLKKMPDFVEAMSALADLYTKKGAYEEGLKFDEKIVQYKEDDPVAWYNLACSYSLLNQIDKSLASIKKAISRGYDNFRHLERDGDLNNLKNDQRFKRYLKKVQKPNPPKSR